MITLINMSTASNIDFVVSTCKIHSFSNFEIGNILLKMVPMRQHRASHIMKFCKLYLISLFPIASFLDSGNCHSIIFDLNAFVNLTFYR